MVVSTLSDKFTNVEHIDFNVDNTITLYFKNKDFKHIEVEKVLTIREKEWLRMYVYCEECNKKLGEIKNGKIFIQCNSCKTTTEIGGDEIGRTE